ncbi:transglycosylase domain-containing protein [uncultured Ruthenibacterium sp.]|uniref:transglycosylase domain-containing protein n=1 Tax=uncultured Ruthenibacterium sp. TaxID=1905347 RepID=UPI00349F01FA
MKKALKLGALAFVLLVTVAVGAVVWDGYQMYRQAVKAEPVEQAVARIQDQPNYTELEELPKVYPQAVVAVEDRRFYSHHGVDVRSIGRAVYTNLRTGTLAEGGSTLTQQLAKNLYFTQEKKFTRKVAEVFVAWEVEKQYDKDTILELYINSIYYGEGCYGVYDASRFYFDKDPADMTDYECTLLAGVPNAPSVYAPTVNPDLAHQRQRIVLDSMVSAGYLTQTQADAILEQAAE